MDAPGETASRYPSCPCTLRTFEIGGGTKPELLGELQRLSVGMNAYGERLFAELPEADGSLPRRLETVELAIRHLGLVQGATTERLLARAESLGLLPCPGEAAPWIRLQYLDQPEGLRVVVASHKRCDDPSAPNGFYLQRIDGRLWLRGYWAAPEHVHAAAEHFLFCRGGS